MYEYYIVINIILSNNLNYRKGHLKNLNQMKEEEKTGTHG
jgi:hypothetical protein